MPVTLYFTSIVLTCALTGFLASFAWRQPPLPGVRVYAWLAFSECLLALAEILSMLSGTQAQALLWFNLRFIFTAIIPVIWLAFSLTYSGQRGWLSNKLLAGALVIPAITQVMLWSNDLHGLWVKQDVGFHQDGPFWIAETSARIPGPWFMLHSFYSLILLLAGIGVIVLAAWGKRRRDRGQALLLSSGALVVLTTTLIPVFNLLPQAEFNLFIPGIGISALLYALAIFRFQFLKHVPGRESASRLPRLEPQERRSVAALVFTFVLFASGLAAAGYLTYQRFEGQFRTQVEIQLSAVAMLKVKGLRDWRDERLADASLFYRNDDFSGLVRRYLEIPGDTDAQDRLARWLERIRANPEYGRVFVLDAQARERISSPAAPEPPDPFLVEQVAATLASGQISMLDLHRDADGAPIHMAILVPMLDEQDGRRLGVLVLRIDPYVYLYPYIEQWPGSSQSAETLLVRRDGDDALFLNELKFVRNAALDSRVPLENTEVLAVKAALGQVGVAQGQDYRGAAVVGYLSAVPESPWFLVARMDTAEVYAPLRERLWQTAVFIGMLILVGALGLTLAWRQQRVRYYRGQVLAAEAVRESEERYKLANRATFDIIWDWNIQTDALWWNENLQAVFGYRAEEIEPGIESWTSRIHPDDVERVQTGIHAAIDLGRQSWSDDYRFRRKDGKYAEIEDRGHIDREASGIPIRMIGAMHDITERKRQEAEIVSAQAGLQRLLADADQARRALLSVVEDQRTAEEGIRILNTQLEQRVAERTAQVERHNRDLSALYQISRTTTASLDLEEMLNNAVETAVEALDVEVGGIYLLEPDGERLRLRAHRGISEETAKNLEWVKLGEGMSGKAVAEKKPLVLDVQDYPSQRLAPYIVQERLRSLASVPLLSGGQVVGAMNLSTRRVRAFPPEDMELLTAMGQQLGSAAQNAQLYETVQRELTERMRSEKQLRESTVQLEAANQELEAFSYSVSHDLRAPLRAIGGFSRIVLDEHAPALPPEAQRYLHLVQDNTQQMGRLVDDLLAFARLSRQPLAKQLVDPASLVRAALEDLHVEQAGRQIDLVIRDLPACQADPALLKQVWVNLLSNALKFTRRRDGAAIEIGAYEEDTRPVYYVKDNGVGFDMRYVGKLFGVFQRLHKAEEYEGTGVGLAIVQRIVHRHGGRVWAEAKVDQGATLWFTLKGGTDNDG